MHKGGGESYRRGARGAALYSTVFDLLLPCCQYTSLANCQEEMVAVLARKTSGIHPSSGRAHTDSSWQSAILEIDTSHRQSAINSAGIVRLVQ